MLLIDFLPCKIKQDMIRELLFGFLLIHSSLAKHLHVHPGNNKPTRRTRLQAITGPGPGPGKKWLTLHGIILIHLLPFYAIITHQYI